MTSVPALPALSFVFLSCPCSCLRLYRLWSPVAPQLSVVRWACRSSTPELMASARSSLSVCAIDFPPLLLVSLSSLSFSLPLHFQPLICAQPLTQVSCLISCHVHIALSRDPIPSPRIPSHRISSLPAEGAPSDISVPIFNTFRSCRPMGGVRGWGGWAGAVDAVGGGWDVWRSGQLV